MRPSQVRITILLESLSFRGVAKPMTSLAGEFARRGYDVTLLTCQAREGRVSVPEHVALDKLPPASGFRARWSALAADPLGVLHLALPVLLPRRAPELIRYLPGLCSYLSSHRTDVLISTTTFLNLVALWARKRVSASRVIATEHTHLSTVIQFNRDQWRRRFLPPLVARTYAWADAIVAISDGVRDDLLQLTGLATDRVLRIYSPFLTPDLDHQALASVDHEWFAPGNPPVILAAGHLVKQKDFRILVRAFALVRAQRPARLVILGDGAARPILTDDARTLGVQDDVDLPGWVDNPFPYMRSASVFVLSSVWEGLSGVLIEALACGCPVVSTDCPSGPSEVLDRGRFGKLVPPRDPRALAAAIVATLDDPPDRTMLVRRASDFSLERATAEYITLIESVAQTP